MEIQDCYVTESDSFLSSLIVTGLNFFPFILMYVYGCFACCMSMYHVFSLLALVRSFSGTGVTVGCLLPSGSCDWNLGPLGEQPVNDLKPLVHFSSLTVPSFIFVCFKVS